MLLNKAIEKYGVENFTGEILEWCYSKDSLNEKEVYWIAQLDTRDPNIGYNLTKGGEGVAGYKHPHSEEHKKNIGIALKKLPKGRHAGSCNPNYGKRHPGINGREQNPNFGKDLSGTNGPNFGHRHTEETKRKISESVKKRRFTLVCKICNEKFEGRSNRSLYCDCCKLKYRNKVKEVADTCHQRENSLSKNLNWIG